VRSLRVWYIKNGRPPSSQGFLDASIGKKTTTRNPDELSRNPAFSLMYVAALANPDFLVEMDAIAVVPQEQVPAS
jgi:hypothetical protein